MLDSCRLLEALRSPLVLKPPTILPDFFVDHFVITGTLDDFIEGLKRLAEQGGGNLTGTSQIIRRGGNSVNTASALLALGLGPHLIVTTDAHGSSLLHSLVNPQLDLTHVHTDGQLAATVSIEADYKGRRVNLMVSDSGSVSSFRFADLTDRDLQVIRESPLVALLCLNHNRNAPELARDLFSMVRSETKAMTFMDMGDPSYNSAIVKPLAKRVLAEGLVDILGMNENEAGWFARAVDRDSERWRHILSRPKEWIPAAKTVSHETGVRVDFHTPHFTASIDDDQVTAIPAYEVPVRVACGAGDSWNAGDILGTLLGLDPRERLTLANSAAALYVSSPSATHPSRSDVIEFLKGNPSVSSVGSNLIKQV